MWDMAVECSEWQQTPSSLQLAVDYTMTDVAMAAVVAS
jgi:hypothetical protein